MLDGDPVTGDVSLSWDSQVGANYSIFGTPDLKALTEVNDNVDSGGTSTSRELNDLDVIGKARYFYLVRKNPPAPAP